MVKVTLDFFIEKHRDQSEALMWLRQQLKEQYKIKFTTFEMAYGIYWRKMNPQISLKNEYKEIPFLEEGSFIGEGLRYLGVRHQILKPTMSIILFIPKR